MGEKNPLQSSFRLLGQQGIAINSRMEVIISANTHLLLNWFLGQLSDRRICKGMFHKNSPTLLKTSRKSINSHFFQSWMRTVILVSLIQSRISPDPGNTRSVDEPFGRKRANSRRKEIRNKTPTTQKFNISISTLIYLLISLANTTQLFYGHRRRKSFPGMDNKDFDL